MVNRNYLKPIKKTLKYFGVFLIGYKKFTLYAKPCGLIQGKNFYIKLVYCLKLLKKSFLVDRKGFEPLTPCLQSRCSDQLS